MLDAGPVRSGGQGERFLSRGWLSVRAKILSTLSIVAVIAVGATWGGLAAQSGANDAAAYTYQHALLPVSALETLRSSVHKTISNIALVALAPDERTADTFLSAILAQDPVQDKALASYKETSTFAGDQRTRALTTALGDFRQSRDSTLIPLAKEHKYAQYMAVFAKQTSPALQKAGADLDSLIKAETETAAARSAQAQASYERNRIILITTVAGGLILAFSLTWMVMRRMLGSLRAVSRALDGVAEGDLTQRVSVNSGDEVGQMAQALNRATEGMGRIVRTIDASAANLNRSVEHLNEVSTQISTGIGDVSGQAETVAEAADSVSQSVAELAAAGEQMGSSIHEISRSAGQAVAVANRAVTVAQSTNSVVEQLGASSARISDVVKTITTIAEQTNLLALNATIEAARAGDQGKGFAVVASEVKDLAQETTRATGDITSRIEAIQRDTAMAVQAIGEIAAIVGDISDHQTTIATAVEEQTATTEEINRAVSAAAESSGTIAERITAVAAGTHLAGNGVAEAHSATADVAKMSSELKELIAHLRV